MKTRVVRNPVAHLAINSHAGEQNGSSHVFWRPLPSGKCCFSGDLWCAFRAMSTDWLHGHFGTVTIPYFGPWLLIPWMFVVESRVNAMRYHWGGVNFVNFDHQGGVEMHVLFTLVHWFISSFHTEFHHCDLLGLLYRYKK